MPFFGESRVMACDRADIERWLRELAPAGLAVRPDGFAFEVDGVPIEISVSDHPHRRIGLLAIPQLAVRFSYPGDARDAAHAWIVRFDRHTQRGGG